MGLISKIQSSPSGKISTRFSHIDLNLIMSKAASLKGMATAIVLTALFESWISHYGTPTKITTEKGSQFESLVMQSVCQLYEYPENQHTCLSSAVKRLDGKFSLHAQGSAYVFCQSMDQVAFHCHAWVKNEFQGRSTSLFLYKFKNNRGIFSLCKSSTWTTNLGGKTQKMYTWFTYYSNWPSPSSPGYSFANTANWSIQLRKIPPSDCLKRDRA